ncbi:MAG: peptidylprolyl isomerase [Deltaproteobacteria bacterium]|nr:peptidylprolyl isomerase [Deltaproteobacteria bacterium]
MRNGRTLLTAIVTGALLLGLSAQAHATVVEKVVAVVGEKAILLSELRARARPFLAQIYQRLPPGAQQAEAVDQLSRQVLARMIDDVLERQVADKHHISVTSEEIDGALERLAGMQNLTVDQLMSEAIQSGLTAQEYRDEIRRQLLEGKLLELRVKGRVRVTDEEMRGLYNRLVRDERMQLGYSLQWIVLRVPRGSNAETVRARRALADRLVAEARGGSDFAAMARTYSDDKDTRELGGDLGQHKPGALEEPIERVAMSLDTGQVSAPFSFADAIVIIKVTGRDASKFGAFEDLREQLAQRVYAEQLEKARRKWLDGIKRGMHIDQRL